MLKYINNVFYSVAILQYLTSALPDIAAHWYPADLKTRAKVNEYMVWHMSDGVRLAAMFRGVVSYYTSIQLIYNLYHAPPSKKETFIQ